MAKNTPMDYNGPVVALDQKTLLPKKKTTEPNPSIPKLPKEKLEEGLDGDPLDPEGSTEADESSPKFLKKLAKAMLEIHIRIRV
jgi:hypothetical protein